MIGARRRMAVMASVMVMTACTTPIVRDTSAIDAATSRCETTTCVVRMMDTLTMGRQEDRYPFMEGYPDTRLAEALQQGRLTISPMNPLLLLAGFYGWSYLEPGQYGQIETCEVRYVPGLNWLSLKHELSHCQGYADHGIPIQIATYTDAQQVVMDREHVTRWVDTTEYKNHASQ